jgi:PAS domain S-box-containing protein
LSINQLRAALRGKRGVELLATLRREVETVTAAVLAADNSSRYVAVNASACELTGYSAAELLQKTVMDLTPWPQQEAGRQQWHLFIATGAQRGEYELRRKNGSVVAVRFWACASVVPGIHVSVLTPIDGETAKGDEGPFTVADSRATVKRSGRPRKARPG